ncbi:MAG: hypothetical protein IJS89_00470 [Bacteroidaceae bacterium]|nr:hypothetical protein [Bacteroidaceae bacterium]
MVVDYRQHQPNLYWHLMTYCNSKKPNDKFGKSVVCGELIFWMAEVSKAVSTKDLQELLSSIIEETSERKRWNKEIQKLWFDKIADIIEQET